MADLIERAEKISECIALSYKAAFKNAYDRFRAYDHPTVVQTATFTQYLEKAEERQRAYERNAPQILRHLNVYQMIVSDSRYPQDNKCLERFRSRIWKVLGTMTVKDGILTEGTTRDTILRDCNTDLFLKCWNNYLDRIAKDTVPPNDSERTKISQF